MLDCNDNNGNVWISCLTCIDSDHDSYYMLCDRYRGIQGPDCNDTDRNNWSRCFTCVDFDFDGAYTGCNAYVSINQDCNDSKFNAWNTCDTCMDADNDGYYGLCNDYYGIQGPDCSDSDPDNWAQCNTCLDLDGDGRYAGCDNYNTHPGPDCNDADPNAWDSCSTCVDYDGDSYFQACDQYLTVIGPDCNDYDTDNWTSCALCTDSDTDGWYVGCDAYATRPGVDCDDSDGQNWVSCATCADADGDGYRGSGCDLSADCSDSDPNNWDACTVCADLDADGWYAGCNAYTTIIGPDCSDYDADNWTSCALCTDSDTDGWYVGCDAYATRPGVDCNDFDGQNWVSCAACADADSDGYRSSGCDLSADCSDSDPNNWNACATCADLDTDGWYAGCDAYTTINGPDCDDALYAVNPSATEVCNGIDDNCAAGIDEGLLSSFYADNDGDSFGNAAITELTCVPSAGYVADSTDCDDTMYAVNPSATEVCNGIDDNCTAGIDEGLLSSFYADNDGDGFGNAAITELTCAPSAGYVADSTDCDDTMYAVNPGATEVCNGIDDNCAAGIDEGLLSSFYADADTDGFGNAAITELACAPSAGYVPDSADCDDTMYAVNPGATEVCDDGVDNNCAGGIDEGCGVSDWDYDGDGLPDAFEIANSSGNSLGNFDYQNAVDGVLDFDGDGNPNVHEFWNGSDPWVKNPIGAEGCFFWGDANGDGYIGPPDNAALTSLLKGFPLSYSLVIPNTGETQDLNADTYYGPPDMALLTQFLKGTFISSMPSRPTGIEQISSGPASVKIGDTTHVTVGMRNTAGLFTPGFGVVFTIDPTSSGSATILGGDGADLDGHRYDVSGTVTLSDPSRVVIRVDSAGEIKINASTPLCGGVLNMGRYCDPLNMAAPFVITGHE